ncbi:GTPase activating protein [Phlyctochytrium planicorne]|nr:GTPase activating protein [Phlyctochytrium planicorne]
MSGNPECSQPPTGGQKPVDLLGGPYDVLLDCDNMNPIKATNQNKPQPAHLLDHPMAKPLLPYIPNSLTPSTPPPPPTHHEYEPARVYLARFAHDLQVARSRTDPSPATSPISPPSLSSSFSFLSGSAIEGARNAVPMDAAVAGRLKMLKEEERIVWDETVEALTGLGAFEVLSTDTTPPPPKVERLKPLSRAEWALYFDVHTGLPHPIDPPPASLADSMIHITHADSDTMMTPSGGLGRIVVPLMEIRRRIFAGGVDPEIRPEVWRYLYGLYPWDSTHAQRVAIKKTRSDEYYRMKRMWLDVAERLGADRDMDEPIKGDDPDAEMYRDASVRVDKDVHRTDRSHPFYGQDAKTMSNFDPLHRSDKRPPGVGPGTPNMNKLRDILITYACSYPGSDRLGFVQGMADLASPIVIVLEGDEADAFWCFARLMDKMKANFRHDGLGMRTHLTTLGSLLKLTDPHLNLHMELTGSNNLFCCFRWFLVLFKREFPFHDVLRLWEVLASGWAGDEFEYFVALAILDEHRDAIVRHLMNFDEILKYVNDLSSTVPLDPTLEAAELLYLRFRVRAASVGAIPTRTLITSLPGYAGKAPVEDDPVLIEGGDEERFFDVDDGVVSPRKRSGSSRASAESVYFDAVGGVERRALRLGEVVERVMAAEEAARAALEEGGKVKGGKEKKND